MNVFSLLTVTEIDGVMVVDNAQGTERQVESRHACGLSFCTAGKLTYTCGGTVTESVPGTAVLLPEGSVYRLRCSEAGRFPLINFHCTPESRPEGFAAAGLRSDGYYLGAFARLQTLCLHPGSRQQAMALLYEMLDRLGQENRAQRRLEAAAAYMEAHFADPALDNAALAEMSHVSEVYFRRLFAREYGVPPHHYLQSLRMTRARQLLGSTALSVSQVAEQCGYASVYHFCRSFRQATGATPTEYRRQFSA